MYYNFIPSSYYPFVHANRMAIYYYDCAFNAMVYGRWIEDSTWMDNEKNSLFVYDLKAIFHTGTIVVLIYLRIFVFFFRYIKNNFRTARPNPAHFVTIVFLFINILYITLVVNGAEYGETQRYRYMTEPSLFILLGAMIAAYGNSSEKNR